jgi:hypothetical protein
VIDLGRISERSRARRLAVGCLAVALVVLGAPPGASAAGHMCSTPNMSDEGSMAGCSYDSAARLLRWTIPTAAAAPEAEVGHWAVYVDDRCIAGNRCGSQSPTGNLPLAAGRHHVELYASLCLVYAPFGGCLVALPTAAAVQDF